MCEEKLVLLDSIKYTRLVQRLMTMGQIFIFCGFFVCVLIGLCFQFEILSLDTVGLKSTFIQCRLITK